MTRVILVRHGETDWNRERRAQGQADIPLNHLGLRQAEEAARRLEPVAIDAVYSSDLVRARVTAEAIAARHGLEVRLDPRLREIDQGCWQGLTGEEIRRRWPALWGEARHHRARPGGESPGEVRRRALEALGDIVRAHPTGTVVVVSHGGTIRWLSAEALGLDDRASARVRGLGNGGAVMLDAFLRRGRCVLGGLTRLDGGEVSAADPNA